MNERRKPGVRGQGRTDREGWLKAGLDTLVSDGIDQVKVVALAEKLDCARSSFYWYFKDRSELLDALLAYWINSNTRAIVDAANQQAETINFALGNLFANWLAGSDFDTKLDFAVRDWARRSGPVRRAVDVSDSTRIEAIREMFHCHGYDPDEADVRARIVYFTQIGYATLDQQETWETRTSRAREYLYCMTGLEPTAEEIASLVEKTRGNVQKR